MQTKYWTVDKHVDNFKSYSQIEEAAKLLEQNETVAFPTETVYGLGANAKNDEAVKKIFEAKGRPSDNPLIVHIASKEQLKDIVEVIPKRAEILMERFWPGPLTLIFKKKENTLSNLVTAGLQSVAIRMPDHPVALDLIKKSGLPIAAPSANTSGKPSPTTAGHVFQDLNGKIAGIVDGGATGVGVESTVLDCTEAVPVILRPGGITKEQIEEAIGPVSYDPSLSNVKEAPKSPGMKYTHYAPRAEFTLVNGSPQFLQTLVNQSKAAGLRVGVFTTEENAAFYDADHVLSAGARKDLSTVAAGLYDTLRKFDSLDVDRIFGEVFPVEGIGQAIMNRLTKAAGHRIVREDE
ncbi:L-threonylcarbamoyladenylate synthase [Peribacillus deserti]|uniref:Threonylcarbamoyl-AMP synthase n=1 Tax=Peribacillus deserti TaxID=673318 RepID=A0ABS2QC17_9BACI|nr:L-threonylcarbamoyladenylate synthase [Peribacillus deserti]MBM7690669.1 L-threonylcarbamoyladenylate synthase [Peribacillus deserti]